MPGNFRVTLMFTRKSKMPEHFMPETQDCS